ncbi:MAG: nitrate reductase molybdenum cofactor assembly chaperone [Thermoleophilia bacterium]|nr:nitrate reductase molybdenum cofactor assembly chaperone [Thermoleophilia bacterium]
MAPDSVHTLKLVSLLLQYPEPGTVAAIKEVNLKRVSPLRGGQQRSLETFFGWYRQRSPEELARAYVDSFDFVRQRSLHLTYHLHGDSRQRGLGLLQIKSAYREAGLDPGNYELPDYLPFMLEFSAMAPEPMGRDLLERHRPAIELIRDSLKSEDSPWVHLFDVIREELPGLSKRQIARIRRLAANGPPTEEVGLEPFAPPEVMPTSPGDVPLPMVGRRK